METLSNREISNTESHAAFSCYVFFIPSPAQSFTALTVFEGFEGFGY